MVSELLLSADVGHPPFQKSDITPSSDLELVKNATLLYRADRDIPGIFNDSESLYSKAIMPGTR